MRKASSKSSKRQLRSSSRPSHRGSSLPPRLRRTLEDLLAVGSERDVAKRLGASHHTLHGYVNDLYRHFGVRNRVDLMVVCWEIGLRKLRHRGVVPANADASKKKEESQHGIEHHLCSERNHVRIGRAATGRYPFRWTAAGGLKELTSVNASFLHSYATTYRVTGRSSSARYHSRIGRIGFRCGRGGKRRNS